MNSTGLTYIYLFVLLFGTIIGVLRFKHFDTAAKVMCLLIGLTFIAEILAFWSAWKYRTNLVIYSTFNIVDFFLTAVYFNYRIKSFTRQHIGFLIGIFGVAIGVGNMVFLQAVNSLNSYFLFFEGITIISMAFYSFAGLISERDSLEYKLDPHFWIAIALVFYWSITFLIWGLYDYYVWANPSYSSILNILILAVNIISYLIFGIIFLLFPKAETEHA